MAEELDFVPMPAKSWQEIKDDKGQPVFAAAR